jgi:hypothetical protein
MNVEQMTPQELRALADKKEQEDKVVRIGYLKCDLYNFEGNEDCRSGVRFYIPWGKFWLQSRV